MSPSKEPSEKEPITISSDDPNHPIVGVIEALNCIKSRDEHLAGDLIEIVDGLLKIIAKEGSDAPKR